MTNPAENLVGTELPNGWIVIEKKVAPPINSGGNFSVSYLAERDGKKAFLKVLDISRAFRFPDFTQKLEQLLRAHNYECELLEACQNKRLTKVINVLDKGQYNVPETSFAIPLPPIPYIIFELAETTSREFLNKIDEFDLAFALRSLHNISVGLKQLHNAKMVHQDLKPSNVLHFTDINESKLGDLGRGDSLDKMAPEHRSYSIAGDPSYAPPELLYKEISTDWKYRRQACDTYHLGSMLMFYFTHTDTTSQIKSNLPPEYHWNNWGGEYLEVLPYLYEAFDKAAISFSVNLRSRIHNEKIVADLEWCLRRLCDPDPYKRGHPKDISSIGSSFSLERFISIFERTAKYFELKF
jgi:serine/threonine protein kinase